MYNYAQKYSGCKTGKILSQAIIMSVRSCSVLLKSSGKLQHPSSGLRFKHENIAFTNNTHVTKILWIALKPDCNMYSMTQSCKPCLHTVRRGKILFDLPVF